MSIQRVAVTVAIDGVELVTSTADFADGGAEVWADLPHQARRIADETARRLTSLAPNRHKEAGPMRHSYLAWFATEESLAQVKELGQITYQSRFSPMVGIESERDIFAELVMIPGVTKVEPNTATGTLCDRR